MFYRGNPRNPRSSYDRGNFGCWFGDFVGDLRTILRDYVLGTVNHILDTIWVPQVVTAIHDSQAISHEKYILRKTMSIARFCTRAGHVDCNFKKRESCEALKIEFALFPTKQFCQSSAGCVLWGKSPKSPIIL